MGAGNVSYTVYKHTSPSGKVYIGITSQRPETRWGRSGEGYKHSPHFRAAIEKYGWDAFEHKILAEGLTKETAERIEIDLIDAHRSTDPRFGYNVDKGGSTGAKHTAETKRKIGEASRRRVWSPESRQKLRAYKLAHPTPPEVAAKIGEANRGKKHRAESIAKIQAAQEKKPVRNLATGQSYVSIQDAARACNLDASHIAAVCRGRRKSTGGAVWRYEEEVIA